MRGRQKFTLLSGICLLVSLPALGQQGVGIEFQTQSGSAVINLEETAPASWIPVFMVWGAPAYSKARGSVNSLQCLATARNRGELRRGISLQLEGEIVGEEGETLKILSRKTRPFNPAARFSWDFPDYSSQGMAVVFAVEGGLIGAAHVDLVKVDCLAINRMRCQSDGETLCLVGNRRFKVQLDFGSGQGRVAASTPRAGLFTVANAGQPDVVVELFDRCGMNDHFWVGVGSMTAVPFEVVIEDTLSGETRALSNQGAGKVMVDAAAFPTCP